MVGTAEEPAEDALSTELVLEPSWDAGEDDGWGWAVGPAEPSNPAAAALALRRLALCKDLHAEQGRPIKTPRTEGFQVGQHGAEK